MDLRCKPRKDKCCIYLPEIPQTERKGPKDRRKSARRPGLRIPGLIQKIGMVNVHLAVLMHVCSIGRAFESRSKGCRFESNPPGSELFERIVQRDTGTVSVTQRVVSAL